MSGSLTQIAAQGQQSLAVVGGDFSPFNTLVRRVTPFATEPKRIEFNSGTPDFGKTITADIDRSADLLSKIWVVVEFTPVLTKLDITPTPPPSTNTSGTGGTTTTTSTTTTTTTTTPTLTECYKCVDDVATRLIQELSVEAGAITHQTLYPEYMHFKHSITTPVERETSELTGKKIKNDEFTGNETGFKNMAYRHNRFYVRLPVWWSETYGKALPIVAQHLTDVKIKIKISPKTDLIVPLDNYLNNAEIKLPALSSNDFRIHSMYLLGEYVYLSDKERASYARKGHAYLITQMQVHQEAIPANVRVTKAKMQPNHPIRAMYWYGLQSVNDQKRDWLNWNGQETGIDSYVGEGELFESAKISFNNQERVAPTGPKYFRLIEFIERHTRIPDKRLYMYSFALAPESSQPSGVVNASRIESLTLELTHSAPLTNSYDLYVFYENYNVVTVSSGITQLAWAS